eukprot:1157570-Pelagomonas_calceolata.AAC.2
MSRDCGRLTWLSEHSCGQLPHMLPYAARTKANDSCQQLPKSVGLPVCLVQINKSRAAKSGTDRVEVGKKEEPADCINGQLHSNDLAMTDRVEVGKKGGAS